MIISILNHTNGQITGEELQGAIQAINRKIAENFEPSWRLGARLRLEGSSCKKPSKTDLADLIAVKGSA